MNLNPNAIPTFLLSFALFWLYMSLTKRVVSKAGRALLLGSAITLAIPGSLFVLYYTHLFDAVAWFYAFRALPYSEFAASGMGAIAGVLHTKFQSGSRGEKLVVPIALSVLLVIPFIKSLLDPVDYNQLRRTCEGEVCLQSTPSTCGPSSAATLLKLFRQTSSEEELARQCFTSQGGTEIWYLARALRRRGLTAEFLIQPRNQISPPSSAIAGVVLPGGTGHFIAILSESANEVTIADPLKGKRVVPRKDLMNTYHFTGFFLLVRQDPGTSH